MSVPELNTTKPVLIVGAGPIGLTTALALRHYGIPFRLFEEDDSLSRDVKAGTILTRTLEAFRRYGVADPVLAKALRVDEIGEINRQSGATKASIKLHLLDADTRFPFVINLPQHHLEPILSDALGNDSPALRHRLLDFEDTDDGIVARFETPGGIVAVEGSYLLGCDGGRSSVRAQLGVEVTGHSLDTRYMLVDLKLDLDIANPRDYPYLAYFSDATEWMILVRQPHCWRFLYPLAPGAPAPDAEELKAKVLHFIGEVDAVEVLGTVVYTVHHRIATQWRRGRTFLMGDAAHLITPMWALGLNTGILDTISLPWRLAWVMRGWADDSLLDGFAREQKPVAEHGSGEMAEAARRGMAEQDDGQTGLSGDPWADACTRALLGVRIDVDGTTKPSMVRHTRTPLAIGERIADARLHRGDGSALFLHDLMDDGCVALYFTDARRRIDLPAPLPGLRPAIVSRWDAPLDSGRRDDAMLDPGDTLRTRLGIAPETLVLVRPDDHVAAIVPIAGSDLSALYAAALLGAAVGEAADA